MGQGSFGAVVGMAEDFAVDKQIAADGGDEVINYDGEANSEINAEREKKNLGAGEKDIGEHVKLSGVFTVFGGFIFREGPLASTSAVKSVGEFGD